MLLKQLFFINFPERIFPHGIIIKFLIRNYIDNEINQNDDFPRSNSHQTQFNPTYFTTPEINSFPQYVLISFVVNIPTLIRMTLCENKATLCSV